MSWSGGTYRKGNYLTNGWTGDAAAGIGIEAGRHDTQDDDFANGINACLAKDGSNAATGNINLNANKIINVSSATTRTDAPNTGQVQDSAFVYGGTSGGAANVQTLTLTPAITAYAAGQEFSFIAGFSNSGTTTLNVNGVGAKNVFNSVTNAALVGGEIVAGRAYKVVYDGTQFQLYNAANVNNPVWAGTTGGTSTAYTLTPSPAITAYVTGQQFRFIANADSGATPTLAISGLAAKNIYDATTLTAIGAKRLLSGKSYNVLYDGTQFRLTDDVGEVQNGDYVWLGTTGGTATAQTASATPAITAYKTGQKFRCKVGASLQSTGTTVTAHTININSLGAKNIVNQDGTNPTAGTWVAAAIMELVYDGTNFVITNDPSGWQTFNPVATGVAPMTVATQSNLLAEYRKKGKEVMVAWDIQVTLGGTVSNGINITMPVNAAYSGASSQYVFGNPLVSSGGAQAIGVIYFSTASNAIINRDGGATPANYSLAGNTYIRLIWTYRGV